MWPWNRVLVGTLGLLRNANIKCRQNLHIPLFRLLHQQFSMLFPHLSYRTRHQRDTGRHQPDPWMTPLEPCKLQIVWSQEITPLKYYFYHSCEWLMFLELIPEGSVVINRVCICLINKIKFRTVLSLHSFEVIIITSLSIIHGARCGLYLRDCSVAMKRPHDQGNHN